MLKEFQPPTQAEECRALADILKELAEQLLFEDNRLRLLDLAESLNGHALRLERWTFHPQGY